MTKPGFTLEEHRAFGARLVSIMDELTEMKDKLGNAYPQPTSRDFDIAMERLGNMRSKLDDIVCKEHPELEDQDVTNIYYGTLSGRRV